MVESTDGATQCRTFWVDYLIHRILQVKFHSVKPLLNFVVLTSGSNIVLSEGTTR